MSLENPKLFIVAGESSGDLLGADLVSKLRMRYPTIEVNAVGGAALKAQGATLIVAMEQLNILGFTAVIPNYLRLIKIKNELVNAIETFQPDWIILIDFPGFNFALLKDLKSWSQKIIYYVSPQIWVWKPKRIYFLKEHVRKVWCILPFEPHFYQELGVDCSYTGNPVLERVQAVGQNSTRVPTRETLHSKNLILLLPGSRQSEIKKHMLLFLRTARLLYLEDSNRYFKISVANQFRNLVGKIFQDWLLELAAEESTTLSQVFTIEYQTISDPSTYQNAYAAIAKSGTVTLELALLNIPTVVVYKMDWLTYIAFKLFVRYKGPFALANILLNGYRAHSKREFPEIIGTNIGPEKLYESFGTLSKNYSAIKECFPKLKEALQGPQKVDLVESFVHLQKSSEGFGMNRREGNFPNVSRT